MVKGPEKYPPGLLHAFCPPGLFLRFPVRRTSPQAHGFHHNPLWRRSEKRAHPDSRLFQIPDWRAENGDSVVHPPSRFYPFGTSQPSHASGRTRVKSSQSVALLSSSVKTYARTSVKPVSPIKCPYTACPSRIAAKETPYPGRVDQLALPGKQKSFFKPHVSPLRLAFPYARCGPPSSATKLPAQKANASLTQCSPLVRTIRRLYPLGDTRLTEDLMARKKGAPERTPPQLQLPLPERQRHFPPSASLNAIRLTAASLRFGNARRICRHQPRQLVAAADPKAAGEYSVYGSSMCSAKC